jgi:hypothetical protein
MQAASKREVCYDGRDHYFQCLDEKEDYDGCDNLRIAFEDSCPGSWVDHFNKQRDRMKIVEAQVGRSRAKAGKD